MPKVQDSDELKLPEGEPLIGLLTQLYSEAFKIPEDQNVDIQSLMKNSLSVGKTRILSFKNGHI